MIDIAFIGVDSISVSDGAGANHEDEARVNRQILDRARKVVVITDSSKFLSFAFARICDLEQISTIVTDEGLSPKHVRTCQKRGRSCYYLSR